MRILMKVFVLMRYLNFSSRYCKVTASCVFVRQNKFRPTKTNLPFPSVRDGSLQSREPIYAVILLIRKFIATMEEIKQEVQAWQEHRNNKMCKINWQFSTNDARIKLKRLYPSYYN